MKNIFIRGKPGSGKTTLIMKVLGLLIKKTAGGFYTEEIREKNIRKGFMVKTLDGGNKILSHVHPVRKKAIHEFSNGVDYKSGPKVGKYRVDLNVIDELIVNSIKDAVNDKDIVIIDEIGKMEMFSDSFKSEVKKALNSSKRVLATIPVYTNSFLDSLTSKDDIEIFDLDMDNRDILAEKVIKKLSY